MSCLEILNESTLNNYDIAIKLKPENYRKHFVLSVKNTLITISNSIVWQSKINTQQNEFNRVGLSTILVVKTINQQYIRYSENIEECDKFECNTLLCGIKSKGICQIILPWYLKGMELKKREKT